MNTKTTYFQMFSRDRANRCKSAIYSYFYAPFSPLNPPCLLYALQPRTAAKSINNKNLVCTLNKFITAICFLAMLLMTPLHAQAQNAQKDSLRLALKHAEGKEKLKIYNRLAGSYWVESSDDLKMDTMLSLYDEMYKEAIKQNDFVNCGIASCNKLNALQNAARYDEVIRQASAYRVFLAEKEEWKYYYTVCRILVSTYFFNEEADKAISEALQFYEQAKKRQHNSGMALALYSLALIYAEQDRYEEYEKYVRQSIELLQKEDAYLSILAEAYHDLCRSLQGQDRNDEILQLCLEFEAVNHRFEQQAGVPVPNTWGNLWRIYVTMYLETGDFDKAEVYCNKIDSTMNTDFYRIVTCRARAYILASRKQYAEALEMTDKAMELQIKSSTYPKDINEIRRIQVDILASMNRAQEVYELYQTIESVSDSIRDLEFNAQLDELRTVYEVDKLILEKERTRNYLLFAFAGCLLLAVALGIWIYLNRRIAGKNRALVLQIREMQALQEQHESEILHKTTFEPAAAPAGIPDGDGFCPDSRKDKMCIAIRDMILKDKIYRNPTLTRDYIIDRLGTNKDLFLEAFQYCFGGISFPEYINKLRLKDAITLLEQSDLTIDEIAEKVGFGTVRTFQRQFQQKYNMSPNNYRKMAKNP